MKGFRVCVWTLETCALRVRALQSATNNVALTSHIVIVWPCSGGNMSTTREVLIFTFFQTLFACSFLQTQLLQYAELQRRKISWRSAVLHQLSLPIRRHNAAIQHHRRQFWPGCIAAV